MADVSHGVFVSLPASESDPARVGIHATSQPRSQRCHTTGRRIPRGAIATLIGSFLLIGCSATDLHHAPPPIGDSPYERLLETRRVPVVPSRSLEAVIDSLPADMLVRGLEVAEERDRVLTVALAPPTRDSGEIARQYNTAYQRNFALLERILEAGARSDSQPPEHRRALETELDHIRALRDGLDPRTIVVQAITVDGSREAVATLSDALWESHP